MGLSLFGLKSLTMAENSKIEWTHHTANLWWGCTEVHAGCDNCYARVFSHRYDGGISLWGEGSKRRAIKSVWNDLAKYQRLAAKAGEIHRVFVGSMMDIFEKSKPVKVNDDGKILKSTGALRSMLFYEIGIGLYPNLMFLLLTKRPSNINKMIPVGWIDNPPSNVMFGTSVVDQKTADTLIPQLMKVRGKKFLSIEPQLNHVDITNGALNNAYSVPTRYEGGYGIEWTDPGDAFIGVDWVIQGGESGSHKRPFHLEWARSMRDQCARANVPYFFKQIDKIQPIPEDLMIRQFP